MREALARKEAELAGTELLRVELEQRVAEEAARAQQAYENEAAALELAEQTEAELREQLELHRQQAEEHSRQQTEASPDVRDQTVRAAQQAAEEVDLDESDTRRLIDAQLRDAGWEVDSTVLRHGKGTRPVKGRNIAIAEWPTASGPADYALFTGLTPVAIVEAKSFSTDIPDALEQAKRYSRTFQSDDGTLSPGGPWDGYRIPFGCARRVRRPM